MTPFGEKLRQLRAEKGINQAELAKILDVSPAYLSALEHGKKGAPSFLLVQKAIQYFGLIWDDAEEFLQTARHSRPKITIDTAGLTAPATLVANLLADKISRLDDDKLEKMRHILEEDG